MYTPQILPLVPGQAEFMVICMVLRRTFSTDHFIGKRGQKAEAKSAFWIPRNMPERQDRGSVILCDPKVTAVAKDDVRPLLPAPCFPAPDNQRVPFFLMSSLLVGHYNVLATMCSNVAWEFSCISREPSCHPTLENETCARQLVMPLWMSPNNKDLSPQS